MKTLAERYVGVKPVGIYAISNWGGLIILELNGAEDTATSAFDWGEGIQDIRITKILVSDSGRPYIRRYGHRYYFDEIMRI